MKKWIIAACLLVVLFIVSTYIFIPSKIIVARTITANANPLATYRFLSNDSNWVSWWPGSVTNTASNAVLAAGGYQFRKTSAMFESFDILISKGESTEKSLLYLFALGPDSTRINLVNRDAGCTLVCASCGFAVVRPGATPSTVGDPLFFSGIGMVGAVMGGV